MAKSSTRRVTIYINGKEVEASVKQIRSEMNKLVNEQNRMVIGGGSAAQKLLWQEGGSARSLRSLAEWCAPPNETRGKDGRRVRLCHCQSPCLRRPSFPFFIPYAAHHSTRRESVERNLLLASERCIGNAQRRAEPPTNTSVSARTQKPPSRSGLLRKKYYFCTVEQSRMNHDRTYRPVPCAPAPRLRGADEETYLLLGFCDPLLQPFNSLVDGIPAKEIVL